MVSAGNERCHPNFGADLLEGSSESKIIRK